MVSISNPRFCDSGSPSAAEEVTRQLAAAPLVLQPGVAAAALPTPLVKEGRTATSSQLNPGFAPIMVDGAIAAPHSRLSGASQLLPRHSATDIVQQLSDIILFFLIKF